MEDCEYGNEPRLKLLPLEILDAVADYLCLSDLIALQGCSRHFREALVRKSWHHFHLDVLDIGDPPEYDNSLLRNTDYDDVCDERSFLAQQSRPLRRIKVDQSNLKSFIQALVNGSLASLLPLVKIFTLETQYFHPKAGSLPMDQEIANASNFDIVNWLFTRSLPNLLCGIRLVELFTEVDQIEQVPVIQTLLSKLPKNVQVHSRIEGKCHNASIFVPTNNLKIFKWVYRRIIHSQSGVLDQVKKVIGNKLPESVERFEIVTSVPFTLDSRDLKEFFKNCRLKTLMLTPIDVDNKLGIDWVPESVEDLALFDCKGEAPLIKTPNIKYFSTDSLTGSIFKRYEMKNLERLYLSSYNGEIPMINLETQNLKQLRCEYMKPELIQQLYTQHRSTIKSLIIEFPGSELGAVEGVEETPKQLYDLLKSIKNLEFLLLDVTCLNSREQILDCLKSLVSQSPNVQLYIQDMIKPRRASWLSEVKESVICDMYGSIRPAGKHVYSANTLIVNRWSLTDLFS